MYLEPDNSLDMKLKIFLSDKGPSIIKKWRDVILKTYPDDTQRFLRKEKDQFSNPVGHIIGKDIEALYNELISEGDTDKILSCLENIIRIRAVQDFKPSQAIAFVIQLKDIIRQELGGKSPINGFSSELQEFENRIDDIALLAFDIYSQCRQKIYEMRVNDVKNQVGNFLKRADLTLEIPEHEPDL